MFLKSNREKKLPTLNKTADIVFEAKGSEVTNDTICEKDATSSSDNSNTRSAAHTLDNGPTTAADAKGSSVNNDTATTCDKSSG